MPNDSEDYKYHNNYFLNPFFNNFFMKQSLKSIRNKKVIFIFKIAISQESDFLI